MATEPFWARGRSLTLFLTLVTLRKSCHESKSNSF